ncbi:TolB family protein [Paenibacillus sp. NPDC056579]|uniref:TolB family protein n=1 Tax=Paenibacillus sp. NPDC056579 TaxID=3345871 RepID=UPI0036AD9409
MFTSSKQFAIFTITSAAILGRERYRKEEHALRRHRRSKAAQTAVRIGGLLAIVMMLASCNVGQGKSMKVIEPPSPSKQDQIKLDRIDRLDGWYGYGWLSEQEMLGAADFSPHTVVNRRNVQTGQWTPAGIAAAAEIKVSPDTRHAVVLRYDTGVLEIAGLTGNTPSPLRLTVGEGGLSYLISGTQGSWADEAEYYTPVVQNRNGVQTYGVAAIAVNGAIRYMDIPGTNEPIRKVEARNGTMFVLDASRRLLRVGADGQDSIILRRGVADFSLSPDGKRLAVAEQADKNEEALSMISAEQPDADGQLVTTGRLLRQPAWSPDGGKLAFAVLSLSRGLSGLYVMDAGTGAMSQVGSTPNLEVPILWDPAGKQLMVSEARSEGPKGQPSTTIYRLK